MPRGVAIALGVTVFFTLIGGRVAHATDARTAAPHLAFLDGPPPLVGDLPPEPTREADEYPRRTWEILPSGGIASPFCRGNAFGIGHCGDASSGPTVGAGALYRISPYIAIGLDASVARFASPTAALTGAYSRASWVGFVVRGYFLDRGMLDPYVETGFGQGSAVAGYNDGGVEIRTESAAPSFMVGAGLDFWVAPYLRVGPAINYRFAWITGVQGCVDAACTTYGVDELGTVGSFATLSLRATIAFGREM